ncbi:YueH family protein [Staphylococcus debuckii]|uniref:YueH family protein n=1 Tax=Staphylococcus debuckii TaxID=2044912 RepID=A0ABU9EYM4_9STAP
MDLLKIRTLQQLEGAKVYIREIDKHSIIAIPDLNWSAELDTKETPEDVEDNLVMYLFNIMDEDEAERLAHTLTLMIFEKEIKNEY